MNRPPARVAFVSRVRLNPYVRLIARGVHAAVLGLEIGHSHFLSLPWLLRTGRHYDILHIHWIEHLYLAPKAWQRRKGFLSVAAALILARLLGVRLVYTVHNLNHHEGRSPILNRWANWLIFHLAHAIHVHDATVADAVARHYGRTHNVFIIPHGSYLGAYPDRVTPQEARAYLRDKGIPIPERAFLFLFLGQVRPYKGVETLITAFQQLAAPRAHLLIVGKAEAPAYAQHVRNLARADRRITTHLTYVPDEELQYFFRAADVCVLPYRHITTSGAALLAFTFGCPIIAPAIGPFRELAAAGRGLLYPPGDVAGLQHALDAALNGSLDGAGARARAYAEAHNWEALGREHARVYERLLCRPLVPKEHTLPPILCAGRDPWEGPWRNRHQLMSRLARHTPVLYVAPRPYARAVTRAPREHPWRPRQAQPLTASPDLHVLTLPAWAARTNKAPARTLSDRAAAAIIRKALARATRCSPLACRSGGEHPILWLTGPDQGDFLEVVPSPQLVVYHVVDDYTAYEEGLTSPERQEAIRAQHEALLRRADVVICTHPGLVRQAQRVNPHVHLVPNAVDWPRYQRALAYPTLPTDVDAIPHPRVGYMGVLNDKIDIPLLRALVDRLPDVHLIIVGPNHLRHRRADLSLLDHPRVHLLGYRSPEELPLYMRALDVALMPYRINRWTQHIDPLKLYEYFALGLPVVSTPIPAVERVRDLLYIAGEADAFPRAVQEALAETESDKPQRRQAFAAANTWEHRVDTILHILAEALARTSTST